MGVKAPVPNLTGRSSYLTEQVNSPRKSGAEEDSGKRTKNRSRAVRSILSRLRTVKKRTFRFFFLRSKIVILVIIGRITVIPVFFITVIIRFIIEILSLQV